MRNRWPLRLILLVFRWLKKVLSRLVTLLRGPRRKSGDVELAFHNDQSAEIASLKKTLLEAEEKASNAKAASEAYSAQIHDLQLQLREERARPEGVGPDTARERGHLQQQLNDKSAHLEQLIRESLAAQKWMSVRDTVTEIHIVEAAQGLNHISSEIATNLSEKLSLAYSKAPSFREHMPPFFPSRVCHHAIAKLDSVDHRESSTLLEIAIAGVVTDFVYEVTTRWNIYLGGGAVLQTSLSRAFDALYRGASIAGNWRALAHRYLNRQDLPTTSQDESAKDTLYNDLLSLLIPFALPFYSNHEEAVMKLESHVAYLLVDLVQALKKFNCDILENMISCSIIPSIAVIHTSYDSSTMQDGWATGEELQAGEMSEVLCSTGIGLRRRTRNDNGDIDEQLLIPPTVALHAVFDVLPVVSAKHDGSTLNY